MFDTFLSPTPANPVCIPCREASRAVVIPFPQLKEMNQLSKQLKYEQKLRRASKQASRSVGCIIALGNKVKEDKELLPLILAKLETIMGEGIHHRILRNYATLMLFVLKVGIP